MFEDDFTKLLRDYPDAIADKRRFFGLLKDLFPGRQRQVNLLCTAFELEIAGEIAGTDSIDDAFAYRFVKRLMEEYGVSRQNADWAVFVWCVCYGKRLLHKPCGIAIRQEGQAAAPAIRQQRPDSAGKTYDALFSYVKAPDGYGIAGFSGPNRQTIIFSGQYHGLLVKRIMPRAFAESDVQEAVMADGIEEIGEGAFSGSAKLRQVILPGTLKKIGDSAFAACPSLGMAALPPFLEKIGRHAFSETGITSVAIPQAVSRLGEGAFSGCRQLHSAVLPDGLADIPDGLFSGCERLAGIRLPEGAASIGAGAFQGCGALQPLLIPSSVSHIGEEAFAGACANLLLLCYRGSAAERYARSHRIIFQIIE